MVRPKFFTPTEVAAHNSPDDLWVSFLGKVFDLTPLAKQHAGDVLLKPITASAGTDISGWFDPKTGDVQQHVDPLTGCRVAYTPRGRFVHVPPPVPRSDWATTVATPWWKDAAKYQVGVLTGKTRKLRVTNMLTGHENSIEVCDEETLHEIGARYAAINAHTTSYTWKHHGAALDMGKTLRDNGIGDESGAFHRLAIDGDLHIPEIQLYFNDDLTIA